MSCDPEGGHTETAPCPDCGERGHPVPRETPRALLRPEALESVPLGTLHFCSTPACPVAYYTGDDRVAADALSVPVFEKLPPGDRMVCYCLEITESELRSAAAAEALERIRGLVASGRCACELRNPSGRCCLGRVALLTRSSDDAATAPADRGAAAQ